MNNDQTVNKETINHGDINRVELRGNATADADVKRTGGGVDVANFSLATHYGNKEKGIRGTEFHRIVAWGLLAQAAQEHVKKGTRLFIRGRLQTRKYDTVNGPARYQTEVVAYDIQPVAKKESIEIGEDAQAGIPDQTQAVVG